MTPFLSTSRLVPLLAGAALAACTPAPGIPTTGGLAEYCEVATLADLEAWVGDVVTRCDRTASAGDHHTPATCHAYRGDRELTIPEDAALVQPAGDRLLTLTADGRLLHGDAQIAAWAAEPRVSEDGRAVAYVALAEGFTEPDLGVPTVIVRHDLVLDRSEIVSDDPEASTPVPVPGGADVLFVSTRSGAASLWRGRAGGVAEQLTNVGMERAEQGFVPVPTRQLAWLASGELVFTAHYETDRVWRLDPTTGVAEELGPGTWPRANADGSVLARTRSSGECAVTYLEDGRTP